MMGTAPPPQGMSPWEKLFVALGAIAGIGLSSYALYRILAPPPAPPASTAMTVYRGPPPPP
jgi:hypothetical protein